MSTLHRNVLVPFPTSHLTQNTKIEMYTSLSYYSNVHILHTHTHTQTCMQMHACTHTHTHTHTHNVCACITTLFLDCIIKIVKISFAITIMELGFIISITGHLKRDNHITFFLLVALQPNSGSQPPLTRLCNHTHWKH